jgi:two-component system phosphate regulon sensor histidine kinase PhoR
VLKSYGSRLAATYVTLILLAGLFVGLFLYHGERQVYIDLLADSLARAALVAGEEAGASREAGDLAALARRVSDLTGARVSLIAHDGTVLADSGADPLHLGNHAGRPEVRTAILGGRGVAIRRSATLGEETLYIAVPAGDGMVARLSVPMSEVGAAVNRFRYITLLPLAVTCLLGLLLALRSAGRITEPLREMSEVAREMAAGNLEARAPLDGPMEAAELGAALNLLATNLASHIAQVGAARERLETLLSGLPAGVIEIDADRAVRAANPATERILGFRLEHVLGRHYSALLSSYQLSEAVQAALERGESGRLEVELGKGPDQAVHVSVSPLNDETGRASGAVLVMEDLGQTRRDARVRRELVANVSHELKTPVASIRALSETLSAGAISDPEAAERFLAHIGSESERLARLVDDLLDLARLEAREAIPIQEMVELSRPVLRAVERFRPIAERKGVSLTAEVLGREAEAGEAAGFVQAGGGDGGAGPVEGLSVRGDERYLERAVGNLLDNAVKFTPEGGRVHISLSRSEPAGGGRAEALVTITDDGPGLPPEAVPRVFERFFRSDRDRSRVSGGTGLGLAIVKHIVQSHGGTLGVVSEGPGRGCRFWFRIPLD